MNFISFYTLMILFVLTALFIAACYFKWGAVLTFLSKLFKGAGFVLFLLFSFLILLFYIFMTVAVSNCPWGIIACPIILLFLWRGLEKLYENTIGNISVETISSNEKNFIISTATTAILASSIYLCIKDHTWNYAIIGYTSISFWLGSFIPFSSLLKEKNKISDIIQDVYNEIEIFKGKKRNWLYMLILVIIFVGIVLLLISLDYKGSAFQHIFISIGIGVGYYGLTPIAFLIIYGVYSLIKKNQKTYSKK